MNIFKRAESKYLKNKGNSDLKIQVFCIMNILQKEIDNVLKLKNANAKKLMQKYEGQR